MCQQIARWTTIWIAKKHRAMNAFAREQTEGSRLDDHVPGVRLDAMMAQLRAAGVSVEVDPERYPNGRFANLANPESNQVQLVQHMPP